LDPKNKKEHDIQLLGAYIPTRVSKKSILLAKEEIYLKGILPSRNYAFQDVYF
tara:strand:- start:8743 stop:8901 length:159 start_codon:yes stop_codon:yes gene_type:complete